MFGRKLGIRVRAGRNGIPAFLDRLLGPGEKFVPYGYSCGHVVHYREKPDVHTARAQAWAKTVPCRSCKSKPMVSREGGEELNC